DIKRCRALARWVFLESTQELGSRILSLLNEEGILDQPVIVVIRVRRSALERIHFEVDDERNAEVDERLHPDRELMCPLHLEIGLPSPVTGCDQFAVVVEVEELFPWRIIRLAGQQR